MIRDLGNYADADISERAELCVIGGGIAGLLVATTLAASGLRVVLLESGSRKAAQNGPLNELDLGSTDYGHGAARVRGLGGTSAIWAGRLLPLGCGDMAARDYLGLAGWPLDRAELDGFTPDIERLFELEPGSYEANAHSLLPQAGSMQPPSDFVARWAKRPCFRRLNLAHRLRRDLERNPRLLVFTNATAVNFALDREAGHIAGVIAAAPNGRRVAIEAPRFVLAAGTLETTRLMLMLDRVSGHRAFEGCDALGRYFHDHLAADIGLLPHPSARAADLLGFRRHGGVQRTLHLETTPETQREDGAPSAHLSFRLDYPESPGRALARLLGRSAVLQSRLLGDLRPDLFSLKRSWLASMPLARPLGGQPIVVAEARIEQVPDRRSRLSLSDRTDPLGVPRLRVDWRIGEGERRALDALVRRLKHYWRANGLDEDCPMGWAATAGPPVFVDTCHPAGTARMGPSPRDSVVGPTLRCHAVPNLFVASAAVFPTSGSANPTLTIMQLALLAARNLLRDRAANPPP